MIRWLAILLLALTSLSRVSADAVISTTQIPQLGVKGLVVDRTADETYAVGVIWAQSEIPAWETGLDITQNYPGLPDLVLAFNPRTQSDCLRMREDDSRLALGPRIGHPVMPFQLQISAGSKAAPLGGISAGVYGYQYGLYLYNQDPTILRNSVVFQNLFGFYTDRSSTHTGDFALVNVQTGQTTFTVQPDNSYCVTAPKEGFFGAPPTTKPLVSGSWSDGTAAKSVLTALVQLGLVQDGTTP
jgi:hypothetical protein